MKKFLKDTLLLSIGIVFCCSAATLSGETENRKNTGTKTETQDTSVLPQGFTETTARQVLVETAGIGAELRADVEKLGQYIAEHGTEGSEKELARLTTAMQKLIDAEKGARVISVSADAQFADFISRNPKIKIRRGEWALQKLGFLHAYVLAEKGETEAALAALDKLLEIAPYCSGAYCERGYLLNRAGNPEAALKSYEKAVELANAYSTERHNQAVALRGAGFSLTSLGKYADARQAYNKSLEFAPGNKIAQDGLAAISQLEKTGER